MIIVLILFFLLILEEILHRLNRGSSFTNVDLAGDSVEQVEQKGAGRITRLLSWLRIVQLFVFALLFAVIAALSGITVICTSSGQLAGLVLLIQVVRIMHRKVINQWAVLGVTVILQVLLLALLLISGITPENSIQVEAHEAGWIVSLMSFIVLFLLSVTMSFTGTFYLRLLSREGSGFYYFMPSLAYSEYWIKRLTRISANSALVTLLMFVFLIINYGYPACTSILQIVLVLLLLSAISLFRSRLKLYHPSAVFLVAAAWIFNIGWVLSNLSSISSGWIA
ncbi:MAG: hypothetical protein KAT09_07225 [Candidatus Aegiribacteria sp.]|nr:hypothetical protein [Candidatus Aegiribacteria sp.]